MGEYTLERDVMVPMRDGVRLSTDIYRPSRPSPALLHRTPYGKSSALLVNDLIFRPHDAVDRGFAVVVQDARGTGKSEGDFLPIIQERADGFDTIKWLEEQPWCNGSVGLYGSSYMGVTALQAAVDAPESVKAVFSYLTGSNYFDGWVYSGGAFELTFNVRWTLARVTERLARTPEAAAQEPVKALLAAFQADPVAFLASDIDVRRLLEPVRELAPYYFDWLDHPAYDDYWKAIDVAASADRIGAPVLHVAGWYDGFLNGHLALHRRLADQNRADRDRLVIGPWSHEAYLTPETACGAGQRDFGPEARGGRAGVGDLALNWFAHWLADEKADEKPVDLPPVRYFLMGENRWRDSASWPPPHVAQPWYLRSDGKLSLAEPHVSERADTVRYDPHSPSPTTGGRHLGAPVIPAGVQDQRELEDRPDVLVYTSTPLTAAMTIAGPVRLRLFVAASAPVTDLFAVLVDVDAADGARNVADGIIRLSAGDGIRSVAVDLLDTAYTFAAGHRVRVHVTSSCFPRFDRNPDAADQQILHDRGHASAILLPVKVEETQ